VPPFVPTLRLIGDSMISIGSSAEAWSRSFDRRRRPLLRAEAEAAGQSVARGSSSREQRPSGVRHHALRATTFRFLPRLLAAACFAVCRRRHPRA